jgi:hypothetical protein
MSIHIEIKNYKPLYNAYLVDLVFVKGILEDLKVLNILKLLIRVEFDLGQRNIT